MAVKVFGVSEVSMKNDLARENTFSLAELSIDGTVK